MLRAVTFDFWGTLYQGATGYEERMGLLTQVLERHGQPRSRAALDAAYHHVWTVWDRVWREEHRSLSIAHWLHEMLAALDAELPEDVKASLCQPMQEVYLHNEATCPTPVPGVTEVVPRLARRYRLGLISDTGMTPGRVLRELLRRDGLLPHFHALTFSDETGATKPLPEQFLHTLTELEAEPEEAAHVGDLPETDLTGARGVGMKAVLFLGVSHRQDGEPLADAVFEAYGELEDLLEKLR